jgi:hypothetical protein
MSNAEKRSVSTDALETLGTLIGENEKRDAIHLAVEPVVANEDLYPGEDIGLISPGVGGRSDKPVGIVDPFLEEEIVKKGQHFWLVLYPRQITSLRHVWSHPAFPEEPEVSSPSQTVFTEEEEMKIKRVNGIISGSEQWLRNFCANNDCPSYETVMEVVMSDEDQGDIDEDYGHTWKKNDDYIVFYGTDAHASIPDEFWEHVEAVTGKRFTTRPTHFSCSC